MSGENVFKLVAFMLTGCAKNSWLIASLRLTAFIFPLILAPYSALPVLHIYQKNKLF